MPPPAAITRREALALGLGATAAAGLSACTGSPPKPGTRPSPTVVATPSAVALEPTVRDLSLRIWAESGEAQIREGVSTTVHRYGAEVLDGDPASVAPSDSYLGPTLHLRTGQRVRVHFENRLPDGASIIHWHGLDLPQDQDGQPSAAVEPGSSYDYDFVVANAEGTYWYHPHPHMHTGEQVYRGLAGLLVVHGESVELPSGEADIALVLQDRTLTSDGSLRYVSTMQDRMMGFVGDTLVTNGVEGYAVRVGRRPYRVRLLGGTNSRTQYLTLSTGEPLHVVATDGVLLPDAVRVPGLVLTPAQRSDLWIDFSSARPGDRIELLTAPTFVVGGGMGMMMRGMGAAADEALPLPTAVAATFVVGDDAPEPGTPPSRLGAPPALAESDAVNAEAPKEFVLTMAHMSHRINGRQWEGLVADELETVRAGTVELWEFVNRSPMAHPMHLHGRHFRVVGRSWDSAGTEASWASIEAGVVESGLRDTVLVWPGQRVRLAVPFGEHRGHFTYHCHILEHEDAGMMRNFRVV